jgi:hypothetical protein
MRAAESIALISALLLTFRRRASAAVRRTRAAPGRLRNFAAPILRANDFRDTLFAAATLAGLAAVLTNRARNLVQNRGAHP